MPILISYHKTLIKIKLIDIFKLFITIINKIFNNDKINNKLK